MALVMRVMIPSGFMMGEASSGSFAIVICSPDGKQTVSADWADPKGSEKAPSDTQEHDAPCVFAGHGLADAPALTLLAAPLGPAPVPALSNPQTDVAPGRGLAAPPPPATGPPTVLI